ncbi:MAG: carboxypeptidase regulatory-like domain-containing protein, partial [Cyclobacteriaceae bacterium]|nr:carboxypeptidase regulatory-like domain-containing protein [Cyclobacteriaceae bacterium]
RKTPDFNIGEIALHSDWNIRINCTENPTAPLFCSGIGDNHSWIVYRNGSQVKSGNTKLVKGSKWTLGNGINVSGNWNVKCKVVGLIGTCEKWRHSKTITLNTARLKVPISESASDSASLEALNNTIKITWAKGTDVPDNIHHYYIVRDYDYENKVWIKGTEPKTWVDVNVNPGETHTYSIWTWVDSNTWGQHQSDTVEVTGNTLPQFSASDGQVFSKTQIRIEWPELNLSHVKSIKIEKEGNFVAVIDNTSLSNGQRKYDDEVDIPGFKDSYNLIYQDKDGNPISTQTDIGFAKPNGRIKGSVKAPFGGPVEGAIVYAERIGDIPQGEDQSLYTDTTDANGAFDIRSIYYYDEANFTVYPVKGDHGFQPATVDVYLELQFPAVEIPKFTDTSSFTVQGKIVQILGNDSAAVEGVEILV